MTDIKDICWQCKKIVTEIDDWCPYCGAYQGAEKVEGEVNPGSRLEDDDSSILLKMDLFLHERTNLHRFRIVQWYCDWLEERLFSLSPHKGKSSGL